MQLQRPLYPRYAWAYDGLAPASGPTSAFIAQALRDHGIAEEALVIDAGCGTGRYALDLGGRGYRVVAFDRSPELIAQARSKAARQPGAMELLVADLLEWRPPQPADAVLCRGVLNDLVAGEERRRALRGLASMLRDGGLLLADVREWTASAVRYARRGPTERSFATGDGATVSLCSKTELDPARHVLIVEERIRVRDRAGQAEDTHRVEMRCWTRSELEQGMRSAGFRSVRFVEPQAAGARSDRIVALATR